MDWLFKFDLKFIVYIIKYNKMFDGVHFLDYQLGFELQQAYFLRDCLEEEISYELKDSNVIIYKKLENGISEEITLDELIFYIHTDVADEINQSVSRSPPNTQFEFYNLFKSIDTIKKTVENMKIILKYEGNTSDSEGDESESEGDESEEDINNDKGSKSEDNETLAF